MNELLKDKIILITGGTGSFGKNFVKFLLQNTVVKKVIVFSRDEFKQFHMQSEIKDDDDRLRFFLGDVRELSRLQRAFRGVDIVIHAAALKQVPTLEYNPLESVKTNIIGSQNVIEAAIDQGVKKVLLISSDKAAQPANLYGSTKLCAEKLFINGNAYTGGASVFGCVRYGNVIGSRGSIVETLLRNKELKKVYITDQRMTRFWITLDQSFRLVFFSLMNMEGGEIFIPKIPSMKVVDLFDAIIPKAEREFTSIRPGEKLHETLVTSEESRHAVELDKYFVILPENRDLFNAEDISKFLQSGKQLSPDFCYCSNTNKEWLTKDQLIEITKNIQI
ncbi:MAG: UDP-N-acetylglucosamine 4,6-dehydratase (inverting) [Candidatus Niyogibacteria bacterium]|nr:UDP-N-acetylglucosamine 4,6-dehydratase (inverting) [Candidatus Niyogibacteria bacterium]